MCRLVSVVGAMCRHRSHTSSIYIAAARCMCVSRLVSFLGFLSVVFCFFTFFEPICGSVLFLVADVASATFATDALVGSSVRACFRSLVVVSLAGGAWSRCHLHDLHWCVHRPSLHFG